MGNLIVRDSKCFNFFTKNRKYKYWAQWGSTWSEIFIFFHAEIAAGISVDSQVVQPSPNKIAPGNWGTPQSSPRRFRAKNGWLEMKSKESGAPEPKKRKTPRRNFVSPLSSDSPSRRGGARGARFLLYFYKFPNEFP